MPISNQDRLQFLRTHVNALADIIKNKGLENDYLTYIQAIKDRKQEPQKVDEEEWSLFLPAERDLHLLAHYHTMRTELLQMTRQREAPDTQGGGWKWLEAPWVKVAIGGATLVKAALVLVQLLQNAGLFLHVPDKDDFLKV